MSQLDNEKKNIQIVRDGMAAILESKSETEVEALFAETFIQHNPWAKDGIEHVKQMLAFDFGYKPARWVVQDDVVAYLGYYTAPNPLGDLPLYCTDMWRVADGKIVEHWDALLPLPETELSNALAGEGDGESFSCEDTRARNTETVSKFLDLVLNRGELDQMGNLVSSEYVYHDPTDGERRGHAAMHGTISGAGGRMIHDNKRLLASGDIVMSHGHFFGEPDQVIFDWFRLDQENKIAEHWSIAQPILPLAEAENPHPHF